MRRFIVSLGFFAAATAFGAESDTNLSDYVWWEGEACKAKSENLSEKHVFNSPHPKLSAGKSLGGDTGTAPTFIEYEIIAPKAGEYYFYARKFWQHGPFKYKFNDAEFQSVGDRPLLDTTKLDQHCVNWVLVDKVNLKEGVNTLRIESTKEKSPFVFDCFVLTPGKINPVGSLKPGQKLGLADPGMWAFEPDMDRFSPDALLDLRGLNEKTAGQSGRVRATPEGDFAMGDGKSIRFWCVNTTVQGNPGTEDLEEHARFLAKRGVNMVRHHGHINPKENQKIDEVDSSDIDAAQKLVAVMKAQGVYTTFSPYWAHSNAGPSWGLKGHSGGQPWGMLFWDQDLQKAYKGWVKELMTRPNPYDKDKTPLAKDPALALFQIQNEDSLLFWTIQTVSNQKDKLARLQSLYDAWREAKGLPKGQLNLKMWEVPKAGQDLKDTMRFFAESMWNWNAEVERFLKEECGYQGLVNAGNWRTADQTRLLDLERWSYGANEVIGVNRYVTGGAHVNPKEAHKAGYLLSDGDYFEDISVLLNPRKLATNAKQTAGKPYIISESSWVPPMSHQSEGPFLIAAYSALNGIDGFYWFCTGNVGYAANLGKWTMNDPVQMGGWPAAVLMFRKGYLKKGEPAVHEERALNDMWSLLTPVIAEDEGFDPNRDSGTVAKECAIKGGIDPMAYLVGPVEAVYGGDPSKSKTLDLSKYIDTEKKIVKSDTGEISMDYGDGICSVNAPKAQGVSGFLSKKKEFALGDLTLTSGNEYATILAVPLDDKELSKSSKVLVQSTTSARPYGWKTKKNATYQGKDKKGGFMGEKIESIGSIPWNVVETDATLSIRNPGLRKATSLDANGMKSGELKDISSKDGVFTVKLPRNATYIVLE